MIGGVEARLGSAEFCGVAPAATGTAGRLEHLFCLRQPRGDHRDQRRNCGPTRSEVVQALGRLGLDLHILSGDRADAVRPVAETLGIAQWQGELKPAEKIAFIEALKAQGRRVLMVGDGLNDAPALATAHVSLSPIAAADVTQAQADAVFLGERLAPVKDAIVSRPPRARADEAESLAGGDL